MHPRVTFDNYVIPETVRTEDIRQPQFDPAKMPKFRQFKIPKFEAQGFRLPRFKVPRIKLPRFDVDGAVIAVAAIGALTFVLGVLVTVQFMRPGENTIATGGDTALPPQAAAGQADETVTRLVPADLLATLPADTTIPDLQAAVLKGLQPMRTVGKLTADEMARKSVEAQQIVNRNKMRMLREGVLAGVYRVETKSVDGAERVVLRTVNAGMTQASIGNLLREAAQRGDIELPPSLNTSEGALDQDTLLFTLIQTSLANDGTPEGAEAAREMSRRAFAASNAQTREIKGERVYTVERGDSLAYISLQFYGRPNDYMRIFEANRDVLRSPDRIRIGQRLKIPQ